MVRDSDFGISKVSVTAIMTIPSSSVVFAVYANTAALSTGQQIEFFVETTLIRMRITITRLDKENIYNILF
jgi:hypothetical protein